jgi:hypothetical protein
MNMKQEKRRRSDHARHGVSAAYVLVAIGVLGVASTGLVAMRAWSGSRLTVSVAHSRHSAAIVQESDELTTLPFDSLSAQAGCRRRGAAPYEYVRCVTLSGLSPHRLRITLEIRPARGREAADTVVIERVRPRAVPD